MKGNKRIENECVGTTTITISATVNYYKSVCPHFGYNYLHYVLFVKLTFVINYKNSE